MSFDQRIQASVVSVMWPVPLALVVILAACSSPPARDVHTPKKEPAQAEQSAAIEAAPVSAPAQAPVYVAPPTLSNQEIQRSISSVLDFLQAGQEDQAEAELRKVIQSDPNHKLAQSLLRQITDDPVTILGSQSYPYRVKPGESLSLIAQRYMNDVHMFFALAKYNGIKVPRAVAGGQLIRLPGKAPSIPATATVPAAALPATPASNTPILQSSPQASTDDAAALAEVRRASRLRSEAISRHIVAAQMAFAKQNLDAALRSWEAVLELEPTNSQARLERQRVVNLKRKLEEVK